jgi:DNA-binding LacI/PurR family transcriptional regulator
VGVSEMAVSFALRGGGRLSQETRRRILQTAEELGYRPHAASRAMSTGRFNCIALILSERITYSDLPPQVLAGIDAALRPQNYHMSLSHFPDDTLTDPQFVPKLLREWFADGLLVNYHFNAPRAMNKLIQDSGIPTVWLNTRQDANSVRPDDVMAARMLTEHLIQLGHRRIAYVDYSHPEELDGEHYSARDRRDGYRAAMQAAGLECREVHRGPQLIQDRVRFSIDWLSQAGRPTAVVGYSGEICLSVIAAAHRMGLDVPYDLSVAAIDARVSRLGPPITTALLPTKQLGYESARMLLSMITSRQASMPSVVLAPTIAAGGTTAPPARP